MNKFITDNRIKTETNNDYGMKEKYNRYNVNSELLKRVIIRLDYQGMTTVDSWVTQLKTQNFGNSQRYSRNYLSSSQVRNYRIGEVMDSLNLPDQAIFNEPLHTFADIELEGHSDMVKMDVANYFTIIVIDCKNYTNIDDYLQLVAHYVELLLAFDPFIQIKRIGIRKVSGNEFENTDQIYDVFEKYVIFPNPADHNVLYEAQSYKDLMYKQDLGVSVNFTRQCREVTVGTKPMVQVLVDIDAYITQKEMDKRGIKLPNDTQAAMNTINGYMFELFKSCVNEKYLNGRQKTQ